MLNFIVNFKFCFREEKNFNIIVKELSYIRLILVYINNENS